VAHACNLSYSGGRDQEDLCSKLAEANSLQEPITKERELVEWLKVKALHLEKNPSQKEGSWWNVSR
jgi:hypothetical protein